MLASVLFTLVTQQSVLFEARPLREILSSLSTESERLEVSEVLGREIYVVKWPRVERRELLEVLSKCAEGGWEKAGTGVMVLRRSKDRERELASAEKAAVAECLEQSLQKFRSNVEATSEPYDRASLLLAQLRKIEDPREVYQFIQNGFFDPKLSAPHRFLLEEALVSLGADALAELPMHKPVVFSSVRTPAQRRLPTQFDQHLKTYVEAQKYLTEMLEQPASSSTSEWRELLLSAARDAERVKKVNLLCHRTENSLWCLIGIYSQSGKLLVQTSATISVRESATPGTEPLPLNSTEGALSATGLELLRVRGQGSEVIPTSSAVISGPLRDILRDPLQNDPLSWIASDGVLSLASSTGAHRVVARVGDDWEQLSRGAVQAEKLNLANLVSRVRPSYIFESTPGTLIIRPRATLRVERQRIPRKAIYELVRGATLPATEYLRSYSRYRLEAGSGTSLNTIDRSYRKLLPSILKQDLPSIEQDEFLLQLLGSLTDAQWTNALQGAPVVATRLSKVGQEFFLNWTSRSLLSGALQLPELPDTIRTGTESMPSGITNEARLIIDNSSEEVLKFTGPSSLGQFFPPMELRKDFVLERTRSLVEGKVVNPPEGWKDSTWQAGKQPTVIVMGIPCQGVTQTARIGLAVDWLNQGKSYSFLELPSEYRSFFWSN